MLKMFEKILGVIRVVVSENQRGIVLWKGEIERLLTPGEYALTNRRNRLAIEWFDISRGDFVSQLEKPLFNRMPHIADQHLTVFRTGSSEFAIVERDGQVHAVLKPDTRLVVWKDAGPWKVTMFDAATAPDVDAATVRRLVASGKASVLHTSTVADAHVGLLHVDGEFAGTLAPGLHAWWNAGRQIAVKSVDTRAQVVEVNGQELLTRDRVTIRVNLAAEYRVADPVKAARLTKDHTEALYRALQLAFRKTLGVMTLDEILEKKVSVDVEAAGKVRTDMAELGLEVGDIALKDVILPGEMRDILNQVVAAEKQAEANVIRRREETNATRSLLNTAKVMAENPVMLRLKELEALETIAGKVDRLTINNGTSGLLNDIVRLRDE